MKLSTKGRYGLRALVDLAINAKGEHVSLASIAERQSISEQYMEHVFSTLRKAGIVVSVKGPRGGYSLSAPASTIRIKEVLIALEGDLSVSQEILAGESGNLNIIECSIRELLWEKIDIATDKILQEITLQDIADDSLKKGSANCNMYYI